ncbi:PLEC protein, partial [Oenanthe oenanthe]|nr:PLEC protein [Oenanthe oenanthe]
TFKGLRDQVTADQLLSSEIINKDLFKKLKEGETSAKEVVSMDTVRKYLQGTGSIGGLLLPDSQEKISIYQAKRKGLLRPGTSLILLEAQAATGFVIDPAANKRYSVDEALRANVIGPDVYDKLLAAEKSVTGYRDPYSGDKISLFQAMQKELIVRDHGIRLLEAQIATGGIIDPVNSHRIPVEAAYKRGYFDKKMNLILSDPSDDTKGFFDPNTHENLTYLQLKEKCITEPSTGLCLLPLNSRKRQFVDEATRQVFRNSWLPVRFGRLRGEKVSVWDLLNSEGVSLWELVHSGYFTEEQRSGFTERFRSEELSLEQLVALVLRLVGEMEMKARTQISLEGLRGSVPVVWLLDTGIISQKTFEELAQGVRTPEEVAAMESVKRYLKGTGSIAGVFIEASKQKMSFYDAMKNNLLLPGVALRLLEAQAASGYLTDPATNRRLGVRDAVRAALVGEELTEKLLLAERAVTGYTDPYTGSSISLCQALRKELVPLAEASHGIRLLEAQIATGGIIDPVHSHRLPVEVAYERGYFNQEMNQILSDPSDDTKGFFDPNTHENLTYLQLLERCVQDPETGLYMLQVVKEGGKYFYIDESTKQALRSKPLQVRVGKFKDQTVSVWEVLCSHYISEQKRKELVMQYKSKTLALEDLISLILKIIEDTERRGEALKVKGLRGEVSVSELFNSEIIDKKTLEQLQDGSLTLASLTKRDPIQRYLDGTGSIAGVLLPLRKEVMSIYQALKKGLLTEQCALGLLEAQAATGFLLDPRNNQKLSVLEAVAAGLVGSELREPLLSAEKAVTGYTDPQTGNKISLFQAVRQKIIVRDHGIRLLEAQIATGGIIDPEHGHRLPVEVAYKRGHLDEDMFLLLSDPDHGSKGFVDPNTQEKISYSQLLQRCARDTESGWYLLQVLEKEKEGDYFYIDEQTKNALLCTKVQVPVGKYKGQVLSLWELLCSEYITEEKRKELVKKYKAESQHIVQGIIETILKIIREKEEDRSDVWFQGIRQQITASELLSAQIITEETMEKIQEGKETAQGIAQLESVRRYLEGTGSIAGVLVPSKTDPGMVEKMSIYQAMWKGILRQGTALVLLEAQAATGFIIDPVRNQKLSVDEAVASGLVGSELKSKLLSAERAVTGYNHPYTGQKMSLFQAMKQELIVRDHGIRLLEAQIATGGIIDPVHSHRLPVEVAYKRGYLDQEMSQILSDSSDDTKGFFDPNTHENLTYLQLLRRCVPDPDTGLLMLQLMDKGSAARCGSSVKFTGLRRQVSASDLLDSGIIDTGTLAQLVQGARTVQEVTQMASVKRYLHGTGVIAGVLVPSKAQPGSVEKMSIYQAMWKGILRQGTALVLLEAQAATGFMVDPVHNQKLSVDEAVASGLVGSELHEKLLSAERAVTGYSDPYTGDKISLFQAMKQELIVRDHGIRLLEAQIATGGIIDPVHSHRLPVEVAYKRGYLDQEMSQILSDPTDDTKGFFDPNTHENLTYLQLLRRCVPDPDTGL